MSREIVIFYMTSILVMQMSSLNNKSIHPTKKLSPLRSFREAANLTQRELAAMIGQHYSNINFWESTGKLPPAQLLPSLTKALGVSVDELLGINVKNSRVLRGKTFLAFEAVSKLPQRQQKKILEVVNALVAHNKNKQQ